MAEADTALKANANKVRRGVKVAFIKILLLFMLRHVGCDRVSTTSAVCGPQMNAPVLVT
jgi:hypothetical protein